MRFASNPSLLLLLLLVLQSWIQKLFLIGRCREDRFREQVPLPRNLLVYFLIYFTTANSHQLGLEILDNTLLSPVCFYSPSLIGRLL